MSDHYEMKIGDLRESIAELNAENKILARDIISKTKQLDEADKLIKWYADENIMLERISGYSNASGRAREYLDKYNSVRIISESKG